MSTETGLPFVILSDLLRPVRGRLRALPPPQPAALSAALALGPAERGDRFAVAAATLAVLSAEAANRGLLVLVEDVQWLDAPSADVLLVVARRLGAEGVLMVVTMRDSELETAEVATPAERRRCHAALAQALRGGGRRMVP